jgi:hypothetical protein
VCELLDRLERLLPMDCKVYSKILIDYRKIGYKDAWPIRKVFFQ